MKRMIMVLTCAVVTLTGEPAAAAQPVRQDPARPGAECRTVPATRPFAPRTAPGRRMAAAPRTAEFAFAGAPMEVVLPPAGWDARTASDEELERYGFPERPAGGPELAEWTAENVEYGEVEPAFCQTGRSNGAVLASRNWSGVVGARASAPRRRAWRQASATWIQPKYDMATCRRVPAVQANSVWPGLGGDSARRTRGLLQNGTNMDHAGRPYIWWEAIDIRRGRIVYDTAETRVRGLRVRPGHRIKAQTVYRGGRRPSVTFRFYNASTRKRLILGPWHRIHGRPVRHFYDGTTAEVIGERSTVSGDPRRPFSTLPRPSGGRIAFLDSWFGTGRKKARVPLHRLRRPERIVLTEGAAGRTLMRPSRVAKGRGGASRWSLTWRSCGTGRP
ncbi:G1 family glutamic endopeptidase [Spirillospora sp. NPDC050679]